MTVRKSARKRTRRHEAAGAWPFLVFAAFVITAAGFMIYGIVSEGKRAIIGKEPVQAVRLPAGASIGGVPGFTVFESKLYGTPVYSFVRYAGHAGPGKANMLLRIDLTVLEPGKTGLEKSKTSITAPGAVISAKIFIQEKKEEGQKEKTWQGISYDEDYRLYRAPQESAVEINGRQWSKLVLNRIETGENGEYEKTWINFYMVHGGHLFALDFTARAGFTDRNTKKTADYSGEIKQSEEYMKEIIGKMEFN